MIYVDINFDHIEHYNSLSDEKFDQSPKIFNLSQANVHYINEFRKDECNPYLDGADEAWVESPDETVGLVRLDYAVPEAL